MTCTICHKLVCTCGSTPAHGPYLPPMPTERKCPQCGRSFGACYNDPQSCGKVGANAPRTRNHMGWVDVCEVCDLAVAFCKCR